MNTKIQFFSIKNSRWIVAWTNQFCNSHMLKAAARRSDRLAPPQDPLQSLQGALPVAVGLPARS